jgi:hypothetical protein
LKRAKPTTDHGDADAHGEDVHVQLHKKVNMFDEFR